LRVTILQTCLVCEIFLSFIISTSATRVYGSRVEVNRLRIKPSPNEDFIIFFASLNHIEDVVGFHVDGEEESSNPG